MIKSIWRHEEFYQKLLLEIRYLFGSYHDEKNAKNHCVPLKWVKMDVSGNTPTKNRMEDDECQFSLEVINVTVTLLETNSSSLFW